MKTIFLLYFSYVSLLLSCKTEQQTTNRNIQANTQNAHHQQAPKISYTNFLNQMKESEPYKTDKKERFFQFINQDVPNYWVGTAWDYNGTTRTPQQGKIACGYFVTNLLVDFEFPIRRIYLAQQPSSTLIKAVCNNKSIKKYASLEQLIHHVKQSKNTNEIFLVGLDYHTGFITKNGNEIYFIHSTYLPPNGVVKEKAENSLALKTSNLYMIGSISENTKWF